MKEYTVTGTITCTVGTTVTASNEDEAKQIATEEFGGVMSFVGNGGTDKLIGVAGENEFIEYDDEPKWDYVSEGEEIDEYNDEWEDEEE